MLLGSPADTHLRLSKSSHPHLLSEKKPHSKYSNDEPEIKPFGAPKPTQAGIGKWVKYKESNYRNRYYQHYSLPFTHSFISSKYLDNPY